MVHELPSEKSQLLQASSNLHPTPPRGGCLGGLLIPTYPPRPNSNVTSSVESHVTPPTHTHTKAACPQYSPEVLGTKDKHFICVISRMNSTGSNCLLLCLFSPEEFLSAWTRPQTLKLRYRGLNMFFKCHSTGMETVPITGSINCRKINTSWAVPGGRWSRPSFPTSWMKKVKPGIDLPCLYKLLSCLWPRSFSPTVQWL